MVAGEVCRGFFQELELHFLFPGFPLELAQPRALIHGQRRLFAGMLTAVGCHPVTEGAFVDTELLRHAGNRTRGLDHHLHGFLLEFGREALLRSRQLFHLSRRPSYWMDCPEASGHPIVGRGWVGVWWRGAEREGVLDVFLFYGGAGEVEGAIPGEPVDEDGELACSDFGPVRAVWQGLGDEGAEDDDVGGVDYGADAVVGVAAFDEAVQAAVDRLPRLNGLGAHQRGRAVQWQDELVSDLQGARQELRDRVEARKSGAVDLVEDLVEQAVGAVFEGL